MSDLYDDGHYARSAYDFAESLREEHFMKYGTRPPYAFELLEELAARATETNTGDNHER